GGCEFGGQQSTAGHSSGHHTIGQACSCQFDLPIAYRRLAILRCSSLEELIAMYETYWKLTRKPFENAGDAGTYYPGESHQAGLLKLRYAIESQRGGA